MKKSWLNKLRFRVVSYNGRFAVQRMASTMLPNLVVESSLKQSVDFKTTASSCLDLVFTSTDSLINSVAPAHLDMFSDHHPVEVNLAIRERISRRLHREYYSYCKCSFDSVITEMKANPFQPYCYSNIDVNTSLW